MKAKVLAAASLLALSASVSAEPLVLSGPQMDGVTAGDVWADNIVFSDAYAGSNSRRGYASTTTKATGRTKVSTTGKTRDSSLSGTLGATVYASRGRGHRSFNGTLDATLDTTRSAARTRDSVRLSGRTNASGYASGRDAYAEAHSTVEQHAITAAVRP